MIINTPMLFNGIYSVIKGWIDEKTRKKVIMVGYNYMDQLSQFVDKDQLPVDVGGTCTVSIKEDYGPWTDYEVIDSTEPNAVVGIRRKADPLGKIFTWKDIAELENPDIDGNGAEGSKGAMIISDDKYIPNQQPNKV